MHPASMQSSIFNFIKKHNLCPEGSTIVLGLSGGPDSIFLLHVLAPLHHAGSIKLIAAHLDHGWRETSANDAQFCIAQAQKLAITCIIERLANIQTDARWNGSQEEMGRNARRTFLSAVANAHNATHIALGHHAQDQQETFFIRLIRGSSIAGLSAMRPQTGMYIRPLLETSKADIITYLDTHQIPYLTDETNSSPDYLRNRIRHDVLPALEKCDTRFEANFAATLSRIQSASDFLHEHACTTLDTISRIHEGMLKLQTAKLCTLHPAVQHQIILIWLTRMQVIFTPTEKFFDEIIRFAQTERGGAHQIQSSWALVKKKGWIWVQK